MPKVVKVLTQQEQLRVERLRREINKKHEYLDYLGLQEQATNAAIAKLQAEVDGIVDGEPE